MRCVSGSETRKLLSKITEIAEQRRCPEEEGQDFLFGSEGRSHPNGLERVKMVCRELS